MAHKVPDVIRLYRIVHIKNVEYILNNGLFVRSHHQADPNYINIGDAKLIQQRNDYAVKIIPPGGQLGDYVPFYFGPLSPMLLNIKTGERGIIKQPQEDIIYLCCYLNSVINLCPNWCFTDGHAKDALTTFYNKIDDLDKVDHALVSERYWFNTEEYSSRMRKKQAEFLVKSAVPVQCIENVVVYNQNAAENVMKVIERLQLPIKVWVNPKGKFYY